MGKLHVENILSLDTDGTGVDMFEFVVGMLLKLDFVTTDTVQGFVAQFQAMDTNGDGLLAAEELEAYAAQQQQLAAASHSVEQLIALERRCVRDEMDEAAREHRLEVLHEALLPRGESSRASSSRAVLLKRGGGHSGRILTQSHALLESEQEGGVDVLESVDEVQLEQQPQQPHEGGGSAAESAPGQPAGADEVDVDVQAFV